MRWPISLTRTLTSSKIISSTHASVLLYLNDPHALIRLNPLVISIVELDSAPGTRTFVVTDKLSFLGLTTTYTVSLSQSEHGVDGDVRAGMGTRLHNRWRVKELDGGAGVEVEETVTINVRPSHPELYRVFLTWIQAFCLLMPFISSTLGRSHRDMLEAMSAGVEERSPK